MQSLENHNYNVECYVKYEDRQLRLKEQAAVVRECVINHQRAIQLLNGAISTGPKLERSRINVSDRSAIVADASDIKSARFADSADVNVLFYSVGIFPISICIRFALK
ncbi:uncharacterized protein LOC112456999 isoform X1 [Temnothorax curvispinosus]|uniref:Uncharacterized protein LOC112456999 isoform X1 n=2 Tax=Temnothorax TaxID=300110 RepID=A0A6J1Q0G1_9HYME|nr:uncharacterized protein LOC112456999 isoform X1 [Temnothorax curvispinosus]